MGSISYPSPYENPERKNYVESPKDSTSTSATTSDNFVVFTEGLTRQQVESATNKNVKNLFDQYNTDGDDIISHDEFQTYFKKNVETSKSGDRVAPGGKYIVKSGDTLEQIARDFRLTTYDIYKLNKNVIGNDINRIQVGMELVIFDYMQVEEDHECDHDHAGAEDHCSETDSCSLAKKYAETVLARHEARKSADLVKIFKSLNEDSEATNLKEVMDEFQTFDAEKKEKFVRSAFSEVGIRFDKAQPQITQNLIADFLSSNPDGYTLNNGTVVKTVEDFNKLDFDAQALVRRAALDKKLDADLNVNNEKSIIREQLADLDENGFSADDYEKFRDLIDDPKFSDEQKKLIIADARVREIYNSTDILDIAKEIKNSNDNNAGIKAAAYVGASYASQTAKALLSVLIYNGQAKDEIKSVYANNANKTVKIENLNGTIGEEATEMVVEGGAKYGTDVEALKVFVENNKGQADFISEIFQRVSQNTTDPSKKEMLNDVIEYANTVIANNANATSNNSQETNASTSSVTSNSTSNVVSQAVSNPIAPQFEYVNQLKEASQAFIEKSNNQANNPDSVIPQGLKNDFKSVKEYLEFKPTGMTVARYRQVKQLLRQNFTLAVENLVKNHSIVPDKFKGKIFNFFGSMDNKTSCELYIEGNTEIRQFMNKYQYMNAAKLLAYAETHHDEVKGASKEVRLLIEELQKQEGVVQS